MKKLVALAVLALCALTVNALADETQIRNKMVEKYLGWREALKNADPEFLIAMEAPEFTHVLQDGAVVSKAESDENLRGLLNSVRKVHHAKKQIKQIRIESRRVIVWSIMYFDATLADQFGSEQRIRTTAHFNDTWIPVGSEWMLKRTQERSFKTAVD